MSEPTDHRAEAEYWLERAGDPDLDMGLVPTYCLIGIGHALLAGLPNPTTIMVQPAVNYVGRCGARADGHRCILMTPHVGISHRFGDEPDPVPLSPSEG